MVVISAWKINQIHILSTQWLNSIRWLSLLSLFNFVRHCGISASCWSTKVFLPENNDSAHIWEIIMVFPVHFLQRISKTLIYIGYSGIIVQRNLIVRYGFFNFTKYQECFIYFELNKSPITKSNVTNANHHHLIMSDAFSSDYSFWIQAIISNSSRSMNSNGIR